MLTSHSRRVATTSKLGLLAALSFGLAHVPLRSASAQTAPVAPNSLTPAQAGAQVPAKSPIWFAPHYLSLLRAPLPNTIYPPLAPGSIVPQNEADPNAAGVLGLFQPLGATTAATNAFFQPLGTNGRACVTCHAPSDALGLNVASVQTRYKLSSGHDPLFAPVDGATCPRNVPVNLTSGSLVGGTAGLMQAVLGFLQGSLDPNSSNSPYYLLLHKGLIRIPLPVPQNAEYVLAVVSDPWGCNTDPTYNKVVNATTGVTSQMVSVYRRPPMAANLKFKVLTAANNGGFPPLDPLDFSVPLPTDPATGQIENGNIMWDGREATLSSQAIDATLGHAQAKSPPTAAQVAQIVAFESGIYSAQITDSQAGSLTTNGATGGPVPLSAAAPGVLAAAGTEVISAFDVWNPAKVSEPARRASIYRGQQIFNGRAFAVTNVAGFNDASFVGNASPQEHCSTCHGQVNAGTDPLPLAQHAIGIGGDQPSFGGPSPAQDLPVFRLTCSAGHTTPFNGSVVLTNDPGRALITGKCADIGKFTVGQIHGLAARAPYFSDGSAAGLPDVVAFYDKRFKIGLSAQDQLDLVAFLGSL